MGSYNSQSSFKYNNRVGFGGQNSQQQRQRSQSSYDSEKCQYYTQEEQRLRQQLKYADNEQEYQRIERQHSEAALQKLRYCGKWVDQSKTLDYTWFDITYSSQLPHYVYSWAKKANIGMKAALYQY